jgi:hypothetical protein
MGVESSWLDENWWNGGMAVDWIFCCVYFLARGLARAFVGSS